MRTTSMEATHVPFSRRSWNVVCVFPPSLNTDVAHVVSRCQIHESLVWSSEPSGDAGSLLAMKIDGHYDPSADIAWLRFEDYDPNTVVAEEVETGLRELEPATGRVVGLEYWQASQRLPRDLLAMLPPPKIPTAA